MLPPRRVDFSAVFFFPELHALPDAVLVRHLVFYVGELSQQAGKGLFGCGEVCHLVPWTVPVS